MTLRTRIKKDMICCIPWKIWEHEIKLLPISAQTLFANRGIEIEKLEEKLKLEGYIHQSETLLNVLSNIINLKREPTEDNKNEFGFNLGDFPEDWTEEDFIYNGFGVLKK